MWFPSRLRNLKAAFAGTRARPARRQTTRGRPHTLHPHLEGLEGRVLLAAGDLDPTFGTGGLVTTDFNGSTQNKGQVAALQSDGKIIVVGSAPGDTGMAFALARYNANGSLDTTFGGGGQVTTDFAGFTAGAY